MGSIADGLWANASCLHIVQDDVKSTLVEFHLILRDGGHLFMALKEGTESRWEPAAYDEHERPRWFTYWTLEDLSRAVSESGFRVVSIDSNGTWIHCLSVKQAKSM